MTLCSVNQSSMIFHFGSNQFQLTIPILWVNLCNQTILCMQCNISQLLAGCEAGGNQEIMNKQEQDTGIFTLLWSNFLLNDIPPASADADFFVWCEGCLDLIETDTTQTWHNPNCLYPRVDLTQTYSIRDLTDIVNIQTVKL